METALYVFKQNKYVGSGACLLNLVYPPGEALAPVEVGGGRGRERRDCYKMKLWSQFLASSLPCSVTLNK